MLLGSPQCLFLIAPSWFPNVYSSIVEVVIQTQIWSLYNNTDYRRTSHPFVLSYIYLGHEKLNTGIYDKKIILSYSKHSFFEWCCQFAPINNTIYVSLVPMQMFYKQLLCLYLTLLDLLHFRQNLRFIPRSPSIECYWLSHWCL